jgi:hypothetical protein
MFWNEIRIKRADHKFIFIPMILLTGIVTGVAVFQTNIAILVGVILGVMLIVSVQFHLHRSGQEHLAFAQRQTQALVALHHVLPIRRPLPPLSGWATTPELAVILMDVIDRHGCRSIVELGSGVSTLIVGYVLEKRGAGQVVSLDHDPVFMEKTRREIAAHGLESYCTVHHAPLVPQRCGNETVVWYDIQHVEFPQAIDLLIVDGPPVKTQRHARYPALPVLAPFFADRVTIVLDDAARRSETEILRRWRTEFPDHVIESMPTMKGTAILRRVRP